MTSPRIAPQTEAQFQRAVTDLAKMLGWRRAHFRPGQQGGVLRTQVQYEAAGFPDLVLVRDRVIFAELKSEKGRVTSAQTEWLEALRAAGVEAYVWKPSMWPEVERILRRRWSDTVSDDIVKALGMTSEDATHDADCEHFREAAMLAARVMQAEDEVERLRKSRDDWHASPGR